MVISSNTKRKKKYPSSPVLTWEKNSVIYDEALTNALFKILRWACAVCCHSF
jgi:hypothetical protein